MCLAKPRLNFSSEDINDGEEAIGKCPCKGYPLSQIGFVYTPCTYTNSGQTCSKSTSMSYTYKNIIKTFESDNSQEVQHRFRPESPGSVTCVAKSTPGTSSESVELRIKDLDVSN